MIAEFDEVETPIAGGSDPAVGGGSDPASTGTTRFYAWGLDLSGTPQGAGGVGGLLLVQQTSANGDQAHLATTYDGNGNITTLIDGPSGDVVGRYDYSPFGQTVMQQGPRAQRHRHQFSTKPVDEETGLVYYGYRYLDAAQGRWPSRDPIGEMGGTNCYEFCLNAVYFYYDHLSMDPVPLDFRDFPSNRATREEAEKKIFPKEQHPGGIPTWARRLLDRGCIGLCSIYQGNMIPSKPNPEDEEGVKCFNTREEAESEGKNCPACTVPAYFTKQGKYKDGKKPKIVVPATGRIPNDSVEALDGKNGTDFNYVTYMPSTQTYAWMNHREYNSQAGSLNAAMAGVPLKDRPQVIVVSGHEPNYDKYKDKMWCVKCKIKSN